MFSKLYGKAGDAAGTALDQDRLAALKFQRVLDGIDCGETRER